MNSKENPFDKAMKSKMENYEVLPDENFWDNIESTMVRKKNMFYIRIILLICSIILIAFLGFKKYSTADAVKSEEPEKTTTPAALPEGAVDGGSGAQQNQTAPVNQKYKSESSGVLSTQPITTNAVDSIKNVSVTEGNEDHANTTAAAVADTTNVKASVTTTNTPKKVVKKPVYIIKQDTIYKVDTLKTKKKKNN